MKLEVALQDFVDLISIDEIVLAFDVQEVLNNILELFPGIRVDKAAVNLQPWSDLLNQRLEIGASLIELIFLPNILTTLKVLGSFFDLLMYKAHPISYVK